MDSSNLSKAKTKDEFINKAHEARQARELSRRQNNAATTIQAYCRAYHIRKKLKEEACKALDETAKTDASSKSNDLLAIIRKLLFFSDPLKDRSILDKLLQLLVRISKPSETSFEQPVVPMSLDSEVSKIELSNENVAIQIDESGKLGENLLHHQSQDLLSIVARSSFDNENTLKAWLNTLRKILEICFQYLDEVDADRLDIADWCLNPNLQYVNTYITIINLFTSDLVVKSTTKRNKLGELQRASLERIRKTLDQDSISKSRSVFKTISTFVTKIINGPNNEQKVQLLRQYIIVTLRLLEPTEACLLDDDEDDFSTFGRYKDYIGILTTILSIPAFTYILERQAPTCLEELNEFHIFKICLKLMPTDDLNLQKLTSTPALCLLANIIHLAFLNESVVAPDLISFVILLTKLLEACQKNMKQEGMITLPGAAKTKRKGNESTDESYSHILGWLAREQVATIDKDSSKLIKLQLSHLWSLKFIKILLDDLIKYNERRQAISKQEHGANSMRTQGPASSTQTKTRASIFSSLKHPDVISNCDNSCGNLSLTPISALKRAVERATLSMTKTISSSYVKTTGAFSSGSGSAKLMTQEATRISLVCHMLYASIKTLRIIKQDILTAFCLHDYVLKNLWTFISSLGPQNGMKTFLDHLALHTKSNAPEFHILILFCECASHLINILDDSELYEQQKPFSLEDLINISGFLNTFVFRIISNQLVSCNLQDMDPLLSSTHKLLVDLYKRDCRREFAPQDHWLIKDIKMSILVKELEAGKPTARSIIALLPHIIPHKSRVVIFRKMVTNDKAQYCSGFSTFITIHRSRIVEDGYQQLARLPPNALKGLIRVKFINDHGLDEAGIDQDGVFKEFLEDTIKRVFDPALNLFSSTSEQRLYPSPTSRLHEDHLSLFNFVGKMLGKAIYEGIVVDVPFASFFLSRVLGQPQSPLYSPIDELPSLDPELYKSLTYIKHYEGDVSDLDLTFSIDQDFLGKIETYELESGGKFTPVTRETRVRYIHSVANFRMKTQIEQQTEAFVRGFKSIIDLDWLTMFSTSEFQRLISGDESPIDLQDLRKHTKYFGGFHNNHRVICWLWDILEQDFTPEELRLFLKFVTSCSKPPLLGFANLEPPFTVRCVEVSDDQDIGDTVGSVLRGFLAIRRSDPVDRLPTSSTCFNLLKLPNYQRRGTLRDKLRYAIRSNPGFELS